MKTTQKRTKKIALSTKVARAKVRKHLKRTLVPHKGNQYRPHLVRLHGITAVLVLAVLMQLVYGLVSSGKIEVLGRVSDISAGDVLIDTNAERAKSSLPSLQLNKDLSNAAFAKAQDMFANNYWAHTSPTGVTPWKWIGDAGYNYDVAGENLAKNYPTAQDTVDAWMGSPTHRANILNNRYQDIGLAVVDGTLDGRPTTLIVAYYGTPATAAVEGSSDARPAVVYAAPVVTGFGNPLVYFGTALQSLTPATLGTLALLMIVGMVAAAAQYYRKKLPVSWRKSWKLNHNMFVLAGTIGLSLVIVFATGGGSI